MSIAMHQRQVEVGMRSMCLFVLIAIFSLTASAQELQAGTQKTPPPWTDESELGIALTGGNSSAATYTLKQSTSYTWDKNILKLNGHYFYSEAKSAEAAKNWDSTLRYERELSATLSGFLAHGWQGDIYSGYDYRTNTDVGGKWYLISGDKKKNYLFNETGYRYTYEHHVPGSDPLTLQSHFVRVYFEGSSALSPDVVAKMYVEFLPDVAHPDNSQLNFEPSLTVLLNNHFSLKTSLLGQYRETRINTASTNFDYFLTTSLVASY